MRRAIQIGLILPLLVLSLSCSGGSNIPDRDDSGVFLTITDIDYGGGAFVSVCTGGDAFVEALTINSNPVSPGDLLTAAHDVVLTRWRVTPHRTDGGTVASPVWTRDLSITVPAGGSTTLNTFNYYSAAFYNEPPLSYLWPENGGFDPETGENFIEQGMLVEWFGETMAGQEISVSYTLYMSFTCQW